MMPVPEAATSMTASGTPRARPVSLKLMTTHKQLTT